MLDINLLRKDLDSALAELDWAMKCGARVVSIRNGPVFNRDGKSYCKVRVGEGQVEREVKTGRFSTDYVEVTEGLKENEQVMLDRPAA